MTPPLALPATEPASLPAPPAESRALSAPPAPPAVAPAGVAARSQLTVLQANVLVAMLGGFWGRKGDGPPGAELLGRGLELLAALVEYREYISPVAARAAPPRKRPRKPG